MTNPIYKRDSQGRIRVWFYEVDGARWRTTAGLLGGKHVTSDWTECVAKSQDTAEAQALFEAEAERQKKLDRVYRTSLEALDAGDMMFQPMLAKSVNFDKLPSGVLYLQPKLDGMRCIATRQGLFSRQGKPILFMDHIVRDLGWLFAKYPDAMLDGELYNHDLRHDFEKLMSMCRKSKTPHPEANRVQYHVYDMYDSLDFSDRTNWLHQKLGFCGDSIRLVETCIVLNENEITDRFTHYLDAGYEGAMLRIDGPYEPGKRSGNLLKLKDFDDEEFDIVDIQAGNGNWAGKAKRIVVRLEDGRTCEANMRGSMEFAIELLERREDWIGSKVTVRFQGRTKDGMLRIPVVTKFHLQGERCDH